MRGLAQQGARSAHGVECMRLRNSAPFAAHGAWPGATVGCAAWDRTSRATASVQLPGRQGSGCQIDANGTCCSRPRRTFFFAGGILPEAPEYS